MLWLWQLPEMYVVANYCAWKYMTRTSCWCIICHIQYNKSVSMVSMIITCQCQHLHSQGQVMHLVSTSKIECVVYHVVLANEIIGMLLVLICYYMWCNKIMEFFFLLEICFRHCHFNIC